MHAAHGLAALPETVTGGLDLALPDLPLPGLDGLALVPQRRAPGHRVPSLAVTARAAAGAEAQARAAGSDGFVRRPVSGALLAATIAGVRAERQRAGRRRVPGASLRGQRLPGRGGTDGAPG